MSDLDQPRAYLVRLMRHEQDQHPGRRPLVVVDLRDAASAARRLNRLMQVMASDRGTDLDDLHYLELTDVDTRRQHHWYRQEID